jgi:peptide subunit release factor 1 (eRF1)
MDSGKWTLKCQNCDATFDLHLTEREQIADYARNHPCPECQNKPADRSSMDSTVKSDWHRVVGFRASVKTND